MDTQAQTIFDAYIGPYKDRHHYWTGMLLLVRAVLFLIFAANVSANPAVNLLATTLTAFSLLAHGAIAGQVYKLWYLNMTLVSLHVQYSTPEQVAKKPHFITVVPL